MKFTAISLLLGAAATVVSACECSNNGDAGRWKDDNSPGDVVARLAEAGGGNEVATIQGRLSVTMSNPGSVELNRCISVYALNQQSWHGDWFLWTWIECKEGEDTATSSMLGS